METSRVLDAILQRKWLILLAAALCAGLTVVGSMRQPPQYEASVTLKTRPRQILASVDELFALREADPTEPLLPEVEKAQTDAVASTVEALVKDPAVLAPVLVGMKEPLSGVAGLQKAISVKSVSPVLLRVAVSDADPSRAVRLVNSITASFSTVYGRVRADEARRELAAVEQQIKLTGQELNEISSVAARTARARIASAEESLGALLRRQQQLRGAEAQLAQSAGIVVVDPAGPSNPAVRTGGGRTVQLGLAGFLLGALAASAVVVFVDGMGRRVRTSHRAEPTPGSSSMDPNRPLLARGGVEV